MRPLSGVLVVLGLVLAACGREPQAAEVEGRVAAHPSPWIELGSPFEWPWRTAAEATTKVDRPQSIVAAATQPKRGWQPTLRSAFDALIERHAGRRQLPAAYVRAVIDVESKFDPRARSHCGAAGLMQLMARTARGLGVRDRYDPAQNIAGGTLFLRNLANRYGGDLVRTTAAYNAGPGAVDKYGGVPPYKETRRYVGKVLRRYRAYLEIESASRQGEG